MTTTMLKTNCVNSRSPHFETEELAKAEILERQIRAAISRQARDNRREAEFCQSCALWMITTAEQRSHRTGAAKKSSTRRRGR